MMYYYVCMFRETSCLCSDCEVWVDTDRWILCDLGSDRCIPDHVRLLPHHHHHQLVINRRRRPPRLSPRPPPFKSPFDSPQAVSDVATLRLPSVADATKACHLDKCQPVPCTSSSTSRPSALARVRALVDSHIASFGLIRPPFVCFFISLLS